MPTPRLSGPVRSAWPWAILVAVYVAVVVLMLAPFSNYAEFASAINPGDAKLLAWTFAWTSHAILTGQPFFDANVFYPVQHSMAFAEHHIGVGIWGLPLYALTRNPILVYSVLMIAGLVLNALAMHLFVWRWFRRHGPALVAGLIFGVSSSRLIYSGHVPLIWNCWLPLILLALDRWAARRQWTWMLAAVAFFALQALATWYLAVMAAVAVAIFAAWRPLWATVWPASEDVAKDRAAADGRSSRRGVRTIVLQGLLAALLSAAIIWPFAKPYMALAGSEDAAVDQGSRYAADIGSYVQPPENALAGPLITRVTGLPTRRVGSERAQFLGLVTILLAVLGAAAAIWSVRPRRRDWRAGADRLWGGYFLLLAAVAVALSFGPSPQGSFPTLFDVISRTPVLGMFRVPSRFAVLVTFAVAGLAALGFAQLKRLGNRAAMIIGTVLVPIMVAEWAIIPPASAKPRADPTPPIYDVVAGLDAHALVSLPCYRPPDWPRDADYMLYSTAHWRPIVNGYGRALPPGWFWVAGAVGAFPGPNSGVRMRALKIDYVVLHSARYRDRAVAILDEARTSRDFQLVAQLGEDYLFRVLPARR